MDLNALHKNARAAAMRGGTEGWGQTASSTENVRYSQPVSSRSRRKCHCGCGRRATHMGMANGLALASGCELSIQRWIRTGRVRAAPPTHAQEKEKD